MNWIFFLNRTYRPALPQEELERRLRFLANRRFEDYTIDLIGHLYPDQRFRFTHKWASIRWRFREDRAAYLTGEWEEEGQDTCLRIRVRPNRALVLTFLLALLLLGAELALPGLLPLPGETGLAAAVAAVMLPCILMAIVNSRLAKRFEKLLLKHPAFIPAPSSPRF
jgi:hypothetical protein